MPELFSVEATLASLVNLENVLRQVGNQAPHAIRRAVNHTGDKALTQVSRTLAKQTGVKYRVVKRALTVQRANYDRASYKIGAKGGYISLKEFDARQTRKGVSAMVWGKRRVFPHSFISQKLGGHVFVRMGKGRNPIRKMWGPALPAELVKAETAAIFLSTVEANLPARVAHEVAALLAGHAPRG
jgi:Prophage minor tail protein Z (GPZ)